MAYYSFEKGKHGGSAGYIFPFFTPLASSIPDGQYQTIVPAGFLKCQGQVLPASSYRSLALAIGVGRSCIYARQELDDPDENGVGGQIQLPDLGSKYIAGSFNPGVYSNLESDVPGQERAGIGVTITATSPTVDFFYRGDFLVPSRALSVSGDVTAVSPPSRTDSWQLNPSNFLPHAHNGSMNVARRINTNNQGLLRARWRQRSGISSIFGGVLCSRRGRVTCDDLTDFGVAYNFMIASEAGSESGSNHYHFGTLPSLTSGRYNSSMRPARLNSSPLVTTVRTRTSTVTKMDEFAPKYILCEYLIKY